MEDTATPNEKVDRLRAFCAKLSMGKDEAEYILSRYRSLGVIAQAQMWGRNTDVITSMIVSWRTAYAKLTAEREAELCALVESFDVKAPNDYTIVRERYNRLSFSAKEQFWLFAHEFRRQIVQLWLDSVPSAEDEEEDVWKEVAGGIGDPQTDGELSNYILEVYQIDHDVKLTEKQIATLRQQWKALGDWRRAYMYYEDEKNNNNNQFYAWITSVLAKEECEANPVVTMQWDPSGVITVTGLDAFEVEPIRHTKHAQGCFQAAGDDEPVFTLRAKDAFAPAVVAFWLSLVQSTQAGPNTFIGTQEEWQHYTEKIEDARHCIKSMVEWQRNNTHKIPD